VWLWDLRSEHLLIERRLWNISVETDGAGGKPDHCPPPPDLPCLLDPYWPDLPPPGVAVASEMDGR